MGNPHEDEEERDMRMRRRGRRAMPKKEKENHKVKKDRRAGKPETCSSSLHRGKWVFRGEGQREKRGPHDSSRADKKRRQHLPANTRTGGVASLVALTGRSHGPAR